MTLPSKKIYVNVDETIQTNKQQQMAGEKVFWEIGFNQYVDSNSSPASKTEKILYINSQLVHITLFYYRNIWLL